MQKISVGKASFETVVLPNDANHYGTVFGGTLLAWMDRTAFIAARKYTQNDVVTIAVDNVVFKNSIKVGEIAEISAFVSYVGRTSVEVCVNVISKGKDVIKNAYFTFVNIDCKSGKSVSVARPDFENGAEKAIYERRARQKECKKIVQAACETSSLEKTQKSGKIAGQEA